MSWLRRAVLALALALALTGTASAQTYVGGATSGYVASSTPSVTYTATSGNLLFYLVTVNGTATCTAAPSGWTTTSDTTLGIFGNFGQCAAWKIASGSDAYGWTLSAVAGHTAAVIEYSGMGATPTLALVSQANNTNTPSSGNITAANGDLVIATLTDSYETAALTNPTGYTGRTLTGASQVHYGTAFAMMGALADKVSSGATENPQWTMSDTHFAGVGAYVFTPSGGGGTPACRQLLLGSGRCG